MQVESCQYFALWPNSPHFVLIYARLEIILKLCKWSALEVTLLALTLTHMFSVYMCSEGENMQSFVPRVVTPL